MSYILLAIAIFVCVDACSSLRWEQMGHYWCALARMRLGLGGYERLSLFKMTLSPRLL